MFSHEDRFYEEQVRFYEEQVLLQWAKDNITREAHQVQSGTVWWSLPSPKDIVTEETKWIKLPKKISLFDKFKKLTWLEYRSEPDQRRNVERWIENLVIAALDIAKIILAAKKELLPEGYKETLMYFGAEYFNESFGRSFSKFAEFRNILAHEYLDIKWRQIKNFIKEAEKLYPQFVEKVKKMSI